MSLPRELGLADDGVRLLTRPIPELYTLRDAASHTTMKQVTVPAGTVQVLPTAGRRIEILARVTPGAACGLQVGGVWLHYRSRKFTRKCSCLYMNLCLYFYIYLCIFIYSFPFIMKRISLIVYACTLAPTCYVILQNIFAGAVVSKGRIYAHGCG